jgi:hypothetical protein
MTDPFARGAVPVPNRLFDEYLPGLKDTELRVLLIIFRQTWGFRDGSDGGVQRFRERDWISHRQLMSRTGRRSGAVSKAVANLVSKGLIVAESKSGAELETAAKRRAHLGRIYYGPGEMWKTASVHQSRQAKTTTDTGYYTRVRAIPRDQAQRRRRAAPGGWWHPSA